MKKYIIAIIIIVVIIYSYFYAPKPVKLQDSNHLTLHFIDVGQADSMLGILPNGETILIDAGNREDGNSIVRYIKTQQIKKIDYVIATHPHEDHIGGLAEVINSFDIGSIYMPKVTTTTKTFENTMLAIKNKGLKVTTATAGVSILNVDNLKIELLAPNSSTYEDLNSYSAVTKITFGNTSFLLTGDADNISEGEMFKYNLKADLLKVGHHGSSTSTSAEFLKAVAPKFAIISVGKGNTYGHPTQKTLTALKNAGVTTYRTDINGTIVATSDGNNIEIK